MEAHELLAHLRVGTNGPYLVKHTEGKDCWCKPVNTSAWWVDELPSPPGFYHRNYEWVGGRWVMLKEPLAPQPSDESGKEG